MGNVLRYCCYFIFKLFFTCLHLFIYF
jgi:hypothetical protein